MNKKGSKVALPKAVKIRNINQAIRLLTHWQMQDSKSSDISTLCYRDKHFFQITLALCYFF